MDVNRNVFTRYIADYIAEEKLRGNEIDASVIASAIDAFEGGAHNEPYDYVVKVEVVRMKP